MTQRAGRKVDTWHLVSIWVIAEDRAKTGERGEMRLVKEALVDQNWVQGRTCVALAEDEPVPVSLVRRGCVNVEQAIVERYQNFGHGKRGSVVANTRHLGLVQDGRSNILAPLFETLNVAVVPLE